jgi:diguanylate cyclase (GGDEF)-like protein
MRRYSRLSTGEGEADIATKSFHWLRVRGSKTNIGRYTCLLAILTIFGGTTFGAAGALARGDDTHGGGGTNTAQSSPGQAGPGSPGPSGDAGTSGRTASAAPSLVARRGDVHHGTPHTAAGPGDVYPGTPHIAAGPGDVHAGPPPVVVPPPTKGTHADDHAGPPPVVAPPPTKGTHADDHAVAPPVAPPTKGTHADDHAGAPPVAPKGTHADDKHPSAHPKICSGICHTGNDHQPSSGNHVPIAAVTPIIPASAGPSTAPQPPPQPPPAGKTTPRGKTTFSFSPGRPSLVQVTNSPNPSALGAGLGSASATGATTQAAVGGLGLLASATYNVGVRGGGSASGQGSGHATSPFGGPDGIRFFESSGVGPGAILTFVGYVPTAVWIALGACIMLAACMSAVALRKGQRASREHAQLARVEAVAKTDPLTGVLNRRGFTEAVERELARARRHGRQFVLAYVDVRGLKAVNDTEGHLAGDELLKGVATLLTESARADDVVGRIGGDELGLLLVEQSGDSAAAVTRRIEAQVSARRSALGLRTPWGLTVGTSAFPEDGGTFDDLVAAADRRLYEQRGIALADGRI